MSDARVVVAIDPLSDPGDKIWDENGDVWGWETDPNFVIVTDDVEGATAALNTASWRLCMTTFGGFELADPADSDGTEDTATPNYMAPPEPHPRGVRVHLDTQGNLSTKMRDHMVHVLVEELERHEVSAQIEQE